MAARSALAELERPHVSTGHLPAPEAVQSLVEDAHRRFKSNADGKNSEVYPALALAWSGPERVRSMHLLWAALETGG